MSDWKPIATAPKADGWFLAASDTMVHVVARRSGEIHDIGVDPLTGEIGLFVPNYTFTHWMPLPAPPKAV